MPTNVLRMLADFGAIKVPPVLASMIASFVRFSVSPQPDLGGTLSCVNENTDDLPIALRRCVTPHAIDGVLSLWPPRLQPVVHQAVIAARAALAARRVRGTQAAAYVAARAAFFAGDVHAAIASQLARQLVVPCAPVVESSMRSLPDVGPRAAFLAVCGATTAACTGARMHPPMRSALSARPAPIRFRASAGAPELRIFCVALGRPFGAPLASVLAGDAARSARLWAAFIDLMSVIGASESQVVARDPQLFSLAVGALARAHLRARRLARLRPRRPTAAVFLSCHLFLAACNTCHDGPAHCTSMPWTETQSPGRRTFEEAYAYTRGECLLRGIRPYA